MKKLNGLILIGGKSTRMGTDKSQLSYHGKAQKDYLFDVLRRFCDEVYFSCRDNQNIDSKKIITDKFPIEAPINGVLSAFSFKPETAWLVVACDMPLVNEKVIETLINKRNPEKIATAFQNFITESPDPLLTIYEPSSFSILKSFYENGNQSLKVFLQENNVEIIFIEKNDFLKNINLKAEFEDFMDSKEQKKVDFYSKTLFDFHNFSQPLKKSDCIFLLGSHDPSVADYATLLFHQKWAENIIVSGGVWREAGELRIKEGKKLEAIALAEIMIEKGVPKEKIIIEDKATNTGENFIFSKQLLSSRNLDFRSFILVQKPYMLRRTFATAQIQFKDFDFITSSQPDTYESYLARCEANQISKFRVLSNMVGDLQRLRIYPEKGFMAYTEIPENVWDAYEKLLELGYDGRQAK